MGNLPSKIFRTATFYTTKQLLKNSSIEDKLTMLALLKEELDSKPSEVTLFSIDKKGSKKPYDNFDAYEQWESWSFSNFPHFKSDLKMIHCEMQVAMQHADKLSDDELPSERQIRGFIEFMTETYMTDEYEEKGRYDDEVIKSHMDSTVIEQFTELMNSSFGGLTRLQCDRINEIVIRLFNTRAIRHQEHDHMHLTLERAIDHGVITLQKEEEDPDENGGHYDDIHPNIYEHDMADEMLQEIEDY